MFGLGRKWPRRTAQLAAAGMLAASGSMFFASTALAAGAGNNGTVKFGSVGQPFTNANDPHINCPIQIQWDGFDPGTQTFSVSAATQNPTGGTVAITGAGTNGVPATFTNQPHVEQYGLTFGGGAVQNNKGEYHISVTINTTATGGASDTKTKTLWVANCAPSGGTVTLAGACTTNTAASGYTWTITATPVAGGAAANFPATWSGGGSNNNAFTVTNGGTFTTPTGTNSITVALDPAAPAGWSVTQPAAATPKPCGAGPVDPSATAAANCNTLSAHLVGGTNGAVFDIVHNGVNDQITVPANQTADPSYNNSGAGATITVSIGGVQKASAKASNSCGGQPTPPSATASADCTALTAHLDGGTNGTTFTIVEPGGTHTETVAGGATKDVSYGTGNGATISVSDGGTVLDTASAPSNCVGSAAPQVSEANHCSSGMNLTLSNMNGTADVTFTVAAPDGSTQTYTVRAGQLKKVAFAVKEDSTGTLSVTAPGLAKQSFSYKKDCASVLGVKHTRKPPVKTHKPVVEGEHAQLPFTGFDTRRALFDGAGLFFFGAVLCMLGARRKNEDYVY